MSSHAIIVVACHGCGRIWALDFEPDECRCEEGLDLQELHFIKTDKPGDYHSAVTEVERRVK